MGDQVCGMREMGWGDGSEEEEEACRKEVGGIMEIGTKGGES